MTPSGAAADTRAEPGATEPTPPCETSRTYREFRPPAHLAAHVECFWRRESGETPTAALILPDGCIDIIWVSGHELFIAGPATMPVGAAIDVSAEVFGVRIRPGVGHQILGIDAREVRDRHALLRDIWPRDQMAPWAAALNRPPLPAKLDAIAGLIADRLGSGAEPDPRVRHAVAWIIAHPHGRMEEMARQCGLGDRQLRRRFAQAVGYGPKTLQRVLRMQRVLWLAHADAGAAPNLARLALAAGYADQAHMTRELTALTGLTPRQLLRDSRRGSAVSESFKTTVGRDATMAL